jgi:hypothetical protein
MAGVGSNDFETLTFAATVLFSRNKNSSWVVRRFDCIRFVCLCLFLPLKHNQMAFRPKKFGRNATE